jgi:hypothetical protein
MRHPREARAGAASGTRGALSADRRLDRAEVVHRHEKGVGHRLEQGFGRRARVDSEARRVPWRRLGAIAYQVGAD